MISAFISLPYDPLETILADCFKGSIIVLISFCVILSLVWLRDQIVNGGGPDWLENIQEDPPLEVRKVVLNRLHTTICLLAIIAVIILYFGTIIILLYSRFKLKYHVIRWLTTELTTAELKIMMTTWLDSWIGTMILPRQASNSPEFIPY